MHDTYRLEGLERPVEILIDRWGIPHLYAESIDDLFFAQGFNAARDRLFQLDLWRRRGIGEMAAAFGPSYLDADRAARLLMYRGDLDAEWAAYEPATAGIVRRFVAGINAYLDWLDDHPDAMPREFDLVGYRPARWRPEDVVRRRIGAPTFNLVFEIYRARVMAAGGLAADRVRQRLEPDHELGIPDGLDLDLPDDVLYDYLLATQPAGVLAAEGSNNWAVAGFRSTTGRPILASDPHRSYAAPSLRYIVHLTAPGMSVIGAGEPALPGVALGHNGTAAFGFTIFTIDTEDLYVCDVDAEPTRVVTERVEVAGGDPVDVELEFTRHGPVLHTDTERSRRYVLRSTASEPGTAPYLGALGYLNARTWGEFEAALGRWRHPGENHVYADTAGTIAWKAAGMVPRRRGYDGLLPLPIRAADEGGTPDWDGFFGPEDLPGVVDPPDGIIATANQFNLPEGYPAPAYEWPDPTRHRRIIEVLGSRERHSMADMAALQTDLLSWSARRVVETLGEVAVTDPRAAAGLTLLRGWDAVLAVDSAAAALYEVWRCRHLDPAIVAATVPPPAARLIVQPDPRMVLEAVTDPAAWFSGPDPRRERDALIERSLRNAYAELERVLGSDPAGWEWGMLHQNVQSHPLAHLDPSLDVGPAPVGGSANTVNAASYWPSDFSPNVGASFRMVIDVGEWDESICISTPGQSGDPKSPHYRDLFDIWREGRYIPMLYTRAAIEADTETRLRLEPS